MMLLLRALAFAACALANLAPSTEVRCQFDATVATFNAPPPPPASGTAGKEVAP